MSRPCRVIIDTDPGIDDAVALFYALNSPTLAVEALTTVFGNVEVEASTRNALTIIEMAGRPDIPVYQGSAVPLMRSPRYAKHIHGEDGLGDVGVREPAGRVASGRAAEEIVRRVMAAPGEITIIALGPPTNLALAALLEPQLASSVREVIYMGGAVFVMGNANPVASANNANDPEATSILYRSGFPLVQVGLDVCDDCYVTFDQLDSLSEQQTEVAQFIKKIARAHAQKEEAGYKAAAGYTQYGAGPWVHFNDLPSVLYATDPDLFTLREVYVHIETFGTTTAGQTVVDFREQLGQPPNAKVALGVDREAAVEKFLATISQAPAGERSA